MEAGKFRHYWADHVLLPLWTLFTSSPSPSRCPYRCPAHMAFQSLHRKWRKESLKHQQSHLMLAASSRKAHFFSLYLMRPSECLWVPRGHIRNALWLVQTHLYKWAVIPWNTTVVCQDPISMYLHFLFSQADISTPLLKMKTGRLRAVLASSPESYHC